MPWQTQSPLGAVTDFVGSYLTSKQQAAQQKQAQAAADKQQAYVNSLEARRVAAEEKRLHDEEAATARALAPPTTLPKELTQGVRNSAGFQSKQPKEVQRDRLFQIAKSYLQNPTPANVQMATFYTSRANELQKEIDADAAAKTKLNNAITLRGVPTYAALHPRARAPGAAAPTAADDAAYAQAVDDIVKTPQGKNPMDTARRWAAHASSKSVQSEIMSAGRQEIMRRTTGTYIPPAPAATPRP